MPILDTQKVTDDLVAAGLPQPQPRAVTGKLEEAAQAARGNLVTVQDLDRAKSDLKSDIAELRSELKGDITELRSELKGDIGELRSEMKGDTANVRSAIAELDARVSDRMRTQFIALVAAMLAVAGVTVAVVRLLG